MRKNQIFFAGRTALSAATHLNMCLVFYLEQFNHYIRLVLATNTSLLFCMVYSEFLKLSIEWKKVYNKVVTVQPAPFVKPHCVLTTAIAAVLLINWRSDRTLYG